MAEKSLEDFSPDQIERMAATYQAMLQNPETREVALRVTKKLDPKMSIPEIDLKDAARAAIAKEVEAREKLENDLRERDARDRIRDERSSLREAGYSGEDVAAIEALMVEENKKGNFLTYDLAARYFKASREVAEPAPHTSRSLTMRLPESPLTASKGGKMGLRTWGRDEANKALEDLKSGRVKLQ